MLTDKGETEGDYSSQTNEEKLALAKEFNCDLIEGDDHTLLLDLDDAFSLKHYKQMLPLVRLWLKTEEPVKWTSRNGNTHVMIKVKSSLSVPQRSALQAILGSDRKREAVHMKEFIETGQAQMVLFRPKIKDKKAA